MRRNTCFVARQGGYRYFVHVSSLAVLAPRTGQPIPDNHPSVLEPNKRDPPYSQGKSWNQNVWRSSSGRSWACL